MTRMRLFAAALPAFPTLAFGQCNMQCVQVFQSRGAPPFETQRQCCQLQQQFVPSAASQRCVTPAGICGLIQPVQIGTPCMCQNQFGAVPGQAG